MATTASWIIVKDKDLLPFARANCQLPTRTRFRVIHKISHFYLNIKTPIKSLIANIIKQIVQNDLIERYRGHFQLAGNKLANCVTIQPRMYICELLVS